MKTDVGGSPSVDGFSPSRLRIELRSGALVRHADGVFRIDEVLDFDSVMATHVESGRMKPLRIGELLAIESLPEGVSDVDIESIADDEWKVANERYEKIRPLIEGGDHSRRAVETRAAEVGVNPATLYRWLGRYRSMDAVSALIPFKRGWKTGKYRLNEHTERVIETVITTYFLKPERPSAQKAVREVHRICSEKNIERPSASAIRARISRIPEYDRLRKRGQAEKARNKFRPVPGKFPGADFPLAVVQIDHTLVDVILVDDVHRKPIGRPWITVAICVFSRMTVGYYLSFDAPSITSVAMCIAHAMLPKEEWLILHKVDGTWPVWGRPKKVHVDNGPDFRSGSLKESCRMHDVDLEFRPVKAPRFGGHIERLQGTLLREIHDIPGSTFSSVADRKEYDSEGRAIMTKDEFERQFLMLICNEYHRKPHSALGVPPFRMWEMGIFGGPGIQGIGLPRRPSDRHTVMLDFLPSYYRTIQPDGVSIDLRYYADALRPWIGAVDSETGKARKHIFRRDPRDMSVVWFYDPEAKQYFKVPLADQSIPPFSIWEYRIAKAEIAKAGYDASDERAVFKSIAERRAMVDESAAKTKKARKEAQRRSDHQKGKTPVSPAGTQATPATPTSITSDVPKVPPGSLLSVVEATDDIV